MTEKVNQISREQLVEQLTADLPASKQRFNVYILLLGWVSLAWLFSISLTLFQAPLRPSWFEQLTTSPQFILEMSLGFSVIVLVALVTFQKAVPGLSRASLFWGTLVVTILWITTLLAEIYYPPFAPSMEGKRALCDLEVVAYSLPLMFFGFLVLKKGFVLNWTLVGFGIGLVSGFIPAVLMQLACMYDPSHALQCHILPAVFVSGVGTLIGFFLKMMAGKKKHSLNSNR
ncbi:MAG: NrsF family protein [Cellvibrionaceae bacterium]